MSTLALIDHPWNNVKNLIPEGSISWRLLRHPNRWKIWSSMLWWVILPEHKFFLAASEPQTCAQDPRLCKLLWAEVSCTLYCSAILLTAESISFLMISPGTWRSSWWWVFCLSFSSINSQLKPPVLGGIVPQTYPEVLPAEQAEPHKHFDNWLPRLGKTWHLWSNLLGLSLHLYLTQCPLLPEEIGSPKDVVDYLWQCFSPWGTRENSGSGSWFLPDIPRSWTTPGVLKFLLTLTVRVFLHWLETSDCLWVVPGSAETLWLSEFDLELWLTGLTPALAGKYEDVVQDPLAVTVLWPGVTASKKLCHAEAIS